MDTLPMPLYHGTSSIFLNGILDSGLGGANPIEDLGVHKFAKELLPIAKKYLENDEDFGLLVHIFEGMVEQIVTHMNFQHGQTYLSPSEFSSARYSASNHYGSELLSESFRLLRELSRRRAPELSQEFRNYHADTLRLFKVNAAPIMIEVRDCPTAWLVTEKNEAIQTDLEWLMRKWENNRELFSIISQQHNFRLTHPIPPENMTIWMLNILDWQADMPNYQKIPLNVESIS